MSDIKICNLDVIAPVQPRQLVVGGKAYDVVPLTCEAFIELNQMRSKLSKAKDMVSTIGQIKDLIKAGAPAVPNEVLNAMSIAQLQLTMAFIYDEIPDSVLNKTEKQEGEPEQEGEPAGK